MKPSAKQKELLSYVGTGLDVFFGGARGGGKCSAMDSMISTPFGFKPMRDICVGSKVSNPDGSVANVIGVYPQGEMDLYRVTFCDGASTLVTLDHLWNIWVTSKRTKRNGVIGRNYKVMTTGQMMERIKNGTKTNYNLCVPLTEPVRYNVVQNGKKLEPYFLGLLLGDGCLTNDYSISFFTGDKEIADYMIEVVKKYDADWYICEDKRDMRMRNSKEIMRILERDKLLGTYSHTKFIPRIYLYAPVEERFELAQGLMDTDGYVDSRGHMSYTTTSEQLAKDFQQLVRSLGAKATLVKDKAGYKKDDSTYVECKNAYTIYFNSNHNHKFVKLKRKADRCTQYNGGYTLHREITSIEFERRGEAQCIQVDHPNSLYICDDFIVTHNTHGSRMCAVRTARMYPGISIVCIRRTYDELKESFINKILEDYPPEVFKYRYTQNQKTCVFANGSRIIFKSCETEKDARKIQGLEYQLMIIDEAPLLQAAVITRIKGSLRRNTEKLPDFIPTLIMTGNPGGISDYYFKTRFIKPDISLWSEQEIEHLANKRVFISAKVYDNAYLGDEYIQALSSITDEALREAWLNGNWDIWDGQFFTQWNEPYHVVEPFNIPANWQRWGAMDLGFSQAHPTTYLEFAQDPNNKCIYITKEYSGVGSIESYIRDMKEIMGDDQLVIYADPSMFKGTGKETDISLTPAMQFMTEGFAMIPANNERINGWRACKTWLAMDETHRPNCMIFNTCKDLIRTIPLQMYSKRLGSKSEDLDTKGEDDWVDAMRYGLHTPGYMPNVIYRTNVAPVNIIESKIDAEFDFDNFDSSATYNDIFSNIPITSYY